MTESISVTHSAACWNDRLLHYGYLCVPFEYPVSTHRVPCEGSWNDRLLHYGYLCVRAHAVGRLYPLPPVCAAVPPAALLRMPCG